MDFCVLLYYCYAGIDDPEAYREEYHRFCLNLNLRGRVIISAEGINGTLSGTRTSCEKYMKAVASDPRFEHTEFKVDDADQFVFEKMLVRVKPEIVHSSLRHIDPKSKTGSYIEPREFREMLRKNNEDTIILDVRSNYEHMIGKFKNAVTLDIDNFRDFPEKRERSGHTKGKR